MNKATLNRGECTGAGYRLAWVLICGKAAQPARFASSVDQFPMTKNRGKIVNGLDHQQCMRLRWQRRGFPYPKISSRPIRNLCGMAPLAASDRAENGSDVQAAFIVTKSYRICPSFWLGLAVDHILSVQRTPGTSCLPAPLVSVVRYVTVVSCRKGRSTKSKKRRPAGGWHSACMVRRFLAVGVCS